MSLRACGFPWLRIRGFQFGLFSRSLIPTPFAWQADYRYARQESHNIFLAWRPLECQGHEPGTRGVATVRTPRPWGARPDRAVHAEADTRSEIRGKRGAAGQLASAGGAPPSQRLACRSQGRVIMIQALVIKTR